MPRYVQTCPNDHLTKLLTAIRAGNLQLFEEILNSEGLPSSKHDADYKLLKKALVYGNLKMAEILLNRGCRVYKPFYKDNSPLHLAASRRNCGKLVKKLLDHGARVDQKNRMDETPLHVALGLAEGKVVDLMLEQHLRNSFVNESNRIGMTFLHIAATRRHLGNVKGFLEMANADVNCQIDEKADTPCAGFTPLHMAVEFNNPKVAEFLLNNGANLWARDKQGSTPLHLALERRNMKMIELLFEHDHKRENYINDFGLSHFMAACTISDPTVCMDYLFNPSNSKTAMVNERVDKFIDLTYPFKNYKPLHFASEYGRQDIVGLLLDNGARCRSRDKSGLMPKQLVVINEYHQAADLFVMRCLQHNWRKEITSFNIVEEEPEDMAYDDDDSGYLDDSNSDGSVSFYDSDFSMDYCDSDDSDAEFWEDDIEDYIL